MILLPFSKNAMPFLKPHTIRYSGKTDIPAYVSSLVFQLNLYQKQVLVLLLPVLLKQVLVLSLFQDMMEEQGLLLKTQFIMQVFHGN